MAVVKRAVSMLRRISPDGPVVFTGGVGAALLAKDMTKP